MVKKVWIRKKEKTTAKSKTELHRQLMRTTPMWSTKPFRDNTYASQNGRVSQLQKETALRKKYADFQKRFNT